MALLDVECAAGHREEVFKRGASDGPFACPRCGQPAKRLYSSFGFAVQPDYRPEPRYNPKAAANAPAVIDRMGGGKAVLTKDGGYRPALTHTARCPKCDRRRNVAIVNELPGGTPRLMCEACGYMWLHLAATAADPLLVGYDRELRPGRTYTRQAPTGSGYVDPERGN